MANGALRRRYQRHSTHRVADFVQLASRWSAAMPTAIAVDNYRVKTINLHALAPFNHGPVVFTHGGGHVFPSDLTGTSLYWLHPTGAGTTQQLRSPIRFLLNGEVPDTTATLQSLDNLSGAAFSGAMDTIHVAVVLPDGTTDSDDLTADDTTSIQDVLDSVDTLFDGHATSSFVNGSIVVTDAVGGASKSALTIDFVDVGGVNINTLQFDTFSQVTAGVTAVAPVVTAGAAITVAIGGANAVGATALNALAGFGGNALDTGAGEVFRVTGTKQDGTPGVQTDVRVDTGNVTALLAAVVTMMGGLGTAVITAGVIHWTGTAGANAGAAITITFVDSGAAGHVATFTFPTFTTTTAGVAAVLKVLREATALTVATVAATGSSEINDLDQKTGSDLDFDADAIEITGKCPGGQTVSAVFSISSGDTLDDLGDAIEAAFNAEVTFSVTSGKIVLTDVVGLTSSQTALTLTFVDADTTSFNFGKFVIEVMGYPASEYSIHRSLTDAVHGINPIVLADTSYNPVTQQLKVKVALTATALEHWNAQSLSRERLLTTPVASVDALFI